MPGLFSFVTPDTWVSAGVGEDRGEGMPAVLCVWAVFGALLLLLGVLAAQTAVGCRHVPHVQVYTRSTCLNTQIHSILLTFMQSI